MQSHSYREHEDDHAIAPIAWWAIVVTTQSQSGKAYEFGGSGLGSPSEIPNTAVD
jgi:hypothetical protein